MALGAWCTAASRTRTLEKPFTLSTSRGRKEVGPPARYHSYEATHDNYQVEKALGHAHAAVTETYLRSLGLVGE